ncbi:MAG: hypothetical protein KGS61_21455 [Verrucomicrobia bacterium]|nr:hypothetical protein [Verrucomicrobiota bacterium]
MIGKLGASLTLAGGVQGTITGVTGQQYAVEASTNRTSWSVLTNITITTNGVARFTDGASNAGGRFYRGVLAPP